MMRKILRSTVPHGKLVNEGRRQTEMPAKYDAQLHILRSVANAVEDPKARHEAQSARHNLFAALETQDDERARSWLEALEVSFHTATFASTTFAASDKIRESGERAINAIRRGLEQAAQP